MTCTYTDCTAEATHRVQLVPGEQHAAFCEMHVRAIADYYRTQGAELAVEPPLPVPQATPLEESTSNLGETITQLELEAHDLTTLLAEFPYTVEDAERVLFLARRLDGVVAKLHHAAWDRRARDLRGQLVPRNAPQQASEEPV